MRLIEIGWEGYTWERWEHYAGTDRSGCRRPFTKRKIVPPLGSLANVCVSVLTLEQINALTTILKNLHVKFGTRETSAQTSKLAVVYLHRKTKFSLGNQILTNGCSFGKPFLRDNIIEIFPIFESLKKVKWMRVLGIAEVCSLVFENLDKLFAMYPLFPFTIQTDFMLLSLQYMYDSSIQNNDYWAFQADIVMK